MTDNLNATNGQAKDRRSAASLILFAANRFVRAYALIMACVSFLSEFELVKFRDWLLILSHVFSDAAHELLMLISYLTPNLEWEFTKRESAEFWFLMFIFWGFAFLDPVRTIREQETIGHKVGAGCIMSGFAVGALITFLNYGLGKSEVSILGSLFEGLGFMAVLVASVFALLRVSISVGQALSYPTLPERIIASANYFILIGLFLIAALL